MVLQIIENNRIFKFIKNHIFYDFIVSLFIWWIMSYIFNTPMIGAIVLLVIEWGIIVAILEFSTRLIKSNICRFLIIYVIAFLICGLTVLFYWGTLVYFCDHDNPYKELLQTGKADIEITIEPNGVMPNGIRRYGEVTISLVKKELIPENTLLQMTADIDHVGCGPNEPNQVIYVAEAELDIKNKAINKPIYDLAETEHIVIWYEKLPPYSKVVNGLVIFIFNDSVRIEIPIPPQKMEDKIIIIKNIKKYFQKERYYEIHTAKI